MKKTKKMLYVCTVHASDRDDVPNHGIRKRGSQNVEVRRAFAESRRRSRQRYGELKMNAENREIRILYRKNKYRIEKKDQER